MNLRNPNLVSPSVSPRWRLLSLVVLLILCLGDMGCRTSYPTRVERPAVDAPAQFLVEVDGRLVAPSSPGASPALLIDPRTNARLRLVRSVQGVGDYQTPPGAYGLHEHELLRVDALGKPLGIVAR